MPNRAIICPIVAQALRMCATLEDYPYSMYEIINFNITMLHFVFFHIVTLILYYHASMLTL